jgi:hypothetical protein
MSVEPLERTAKCGSGNRADNLTESSIMRKFLPLGLALLAVASVAAPTFAADADQSKLSAAIESGDLKFAPAPSDVAFDAIKITGRPEETRGTLDAFGVVDARGTGAGYHLTLQASQFKSDAGILPADSLMIGDTNVKAGEGVTSKAPVWSGNRTIDNETGIVALSADIDTGLGLFEIQKSEMTLAIPASVKAGAYTSVLEATIVTGP